jgi:soluble lytic murein transglycosylase-like protein
MHSMMLAGAALFVPHAGVPPARPTPPIKLVKVQKTPAGLVTTTSLFRLAGDHEFDDLIEEASQTYGLSTTLIRAVIRTESAFDSLAVSPAGAQGLMQLMPALCLDLNVTDPFDPRQNIMAGTRYLSALLAKHHGNLALALASYNAGPGNVERYKGIPPFKETRSYVQRITKLVGSDVEADE